MTIQELALRGVDDALATRLELFAQEHGLSLNEAALHLLRRGARLSEEGSQAETIGDGLDEFIGSWDQERAREVLTAVEAFEQIDEDLGR